MKKSTFQLCLRTVDSMTTLQRHDLKVAIERRDKKDLVADVASLVGNPTMWPHCHHPEIRPWGQAAGLPSYRCRGCHRTFSALTKTPLAGLHHKDRWMYFLEKLSEGESVRKAAWRCRINAKAAFLWRHRFLVLPACLKARKENGAAKPQNGGSLGNKFPSWWSGTDRARPPMRSFRRTPIGRSKPCWAHSWPGMRFFARTVEGKAPSLWRPGRWAWPTGR